MLEGAKARDPLVSRSNSATFLPRFVSFAAHIGPDPKHCLLQDLQPSFAPRAHRNMPGNFYHCYRGETEPVYSEAAKQTDRGCGCLDLPRCLTLPLQMPVMPHAQRFRGFDMSLSLYSAEYFSVLWGLDNSCFLSPCRVVTATIKAHCKLLLQSHEEKEKHLKSGPRGQRVSQPLFSSLLWRALTRMTPSLLDCPAHLAALPLAEKESAELTRCRAIVTALNYYIY